MLSKREDVEDDMNGTFSSRFACGGRDSNSKLQSLIPPTQLGKTLKNIMNLNIYIQYLVLKING